MHWFRRWRRVRASVGEQVLPEHESAVRRLVADAHGDEYVALESLAEARQVEDAAVVMEGDYGGSIYLTCPVGLVVCDEESLRELLIDLDKLDWDNPGGTGLYFEVAPPGTGIAGGSGGGIVTDSLWLHPDLERQRIRDQVESVIFTPPTSR